ncbi:MAG: 1-acyl-sn-glycerol-3-phosphate acyltransferase [Myxococcales bacterium]|nr:1-acyl-sn-glycerol-3-phosphate acyltransferase [Myxococcales bacterium]
MRVYRLLQAFLRFATSIFFRRIQVVGAEHIPEDGPVIFCGNHPNSLLDPALITAWGGRIVHFAAKDVLFRSRVLRVFLGAAGAVPIRRAKDHQGEALDNTEAFEQLFAVLAKGRAMGIFPEGISHDASQLARLKTGAARIALGAARAHPEARFALVPCGLHYVHRRRFRSSVLIQFGPPIFIDEAVLAEAATAERETVRALTTRIEAGMRALTVNAEDWETLRVIDGVRRLYQPPRISLPQRVELARRFNAVYPSVKDEPSIMALFERVQAYQDRLADLGLQDADVVRRRRPGRVLGRVLAHLVFMVLWMPLALIGLPLHLPLGYLLRYGSWRFAPRKDVVATTKFLVGFMLLGLAYVVIAGAVAWWAGPAWGVAALFGLPLAGYATLRVLERGAAVFRVFLTLGRLLRLQAELEALVVERKALENEVLEAVNRFLPADMERLFHREAEA